MLKDFKKFILRGNVVDLAVGVVVGAAFTTIVNALVKDIIGPLIAAVIRTPDFSALTIVINHSKFYYGDFINAIISFIIIAVAVFFLVVVPINALVARARRDIPEDASIKKCPECLSDVPVTAKRCAFCTQPIV